MVEIINLPLEQSDIKLFIYRSNYLLDLEDEEMTFINNYIHDKIFFKYNHLEII
jgi:hypothetical protein